MLATLHLVLELGEGRAGLVLNGEVEHAGCHVVPHELDADLDTASFFPLLPWPGLQGVPAKTELERLSLMDRRLVLRISRCQAENAKGKGGKSSKLGTLIYTTFIDISI